MCRGETTIMSTKTPVEHTVILDSMGGCNVLSCETLVIKNIEHPYGEPTEQSIKKTIMDFKFITDEKDAPFNIRVIDIRPPEKNFNRLKEEQSKAMPRRKTNFL